MISSSRWSTAAASSRTVPTVLPLPPGGKVSITRCAPPAVTRSSVAGHATEKGGVAFGGVEVHHVAGNELDRSSPTQLSQRTTSGLNSVISWSWSSGTTVTQLSDHEKGLPALSSETRSVAPQPGIAALATEMPRVDAWTSSPGSEAHRD